ncbi:EF-hand domain-containing protein [Streptomyces goshikiensis]|uniref:EF-hand domain-containing protein n=1 Tax=Streptomyces goshikiensis TaxID=1942 RepID=UPI0036A26591
MITPERIRQLKSAFAVFDANRDGKLDAIELVNLIRGSCDIRSRVRMSPFEFASISQSSSRDKEFINRHYSRFKLVDSDGDGLITLRELAAYYGISEEDEALKEYFRLADSNHDGKLDFFEFLEVSVKRSGSSGEPYVIANCHAVYPDACSEGGNRGIVPDCAPDGALTLFLDWCFNQTNAGQPEFDHPAIAIPSGKSIDSVWEYFSPVVDNPGPIHGVTCSWANKTDQECVLFGRWDNLEPGWTTVEDVLVLAPGESLIEHVIRGHANAFRVYKATAFNRYVPKPVIVSPAAGSIVAPWAAVSGTSRSAETVKIFDGDALLGTSTVSGDRWSFTLPGGDEWPLGSNNLTVVAVRGTYESDPVSVEFSVAEQNLKVQGTLAGSWSGDASGYIYSYDITLKAGEGDVARWEVGFGMLPPGSRLDPTFVTEFWGEVIQDGDPEDEVVNIVLGSGGSGIVLAGECLTVRVRVMIPPNHFQEAYRQLYGLYATALSAL